MSACVCVLVISEYIVESYLVVLAVLYSVVFVAVFLYPCLSHLIDCLITADITGTCISRLCVK